MAAGKKGAQLQLQAEINTDEEWEKLVDKEGLIVVDVYSEWCGPCIGMVGNLKKLKVEVGGDNLHLAIAKSDGIGCLKRFRKRSEPTWMFISDRHIVNLMFGADAPKLTRLIVQELENEAKAQKNEKERIKIPFNELTPAELDRKTIQDKKDEEIAELERKAVVENLLMKRKKRSEMVTPFIIDFNVILYWPHAFDGHKMVYEAWDPLGISIADKETPLLNEEKYEEVFFNTPEILNNDAAKRALLEKPCLIVLLKQNPDKGGDIIEKVRNVIYNNTVKSEKTQTGEDETEKDEEKSIADKFCMTMEDNVVIPGIYAPHDTISKAAAINTLFSKIVAQFLEPELPSPPPHIGVVYDAFKRKEVLELCNKFKSEVLKLGFFSTGDPQTAVNIGITPEEYENNHQQKEYGEKLIIMLCKINKETVLAFEDLGPTYISPNAVEGSMECVIFFPPGYGEKPKQVITVTKKKRGKKKIDTTKGVSGEKPGNEIEKTDQDNINTEIEENGDKNESDEGDLHDNEDGENDDSETVANDEKTKEKE